MERIEVVRYLVDGSIFRALMLCLVLVQNDNLVVAHLTNLCLVIQTEKDVLTEGTLDKFGGSRTVISSFQP